MIDPVITLSIRFAFALLFAFAAIEKLRDREMFLFQLDEYRLLPRALVPIVGPLIIAAEMLTAILLLLHTPVYGVIAGSLLLGVYGLGILINLLRGRTWMDCGCLGSDGEGLSYWLVLRNLVLLAALVLVLAPTIDRSLIWLDYFSMLFTTVAVSIAYLAFHLLLAANTRSKMWWGSR
jgi:hypothetical protein